MSTLQVLKCFGEFDGEYWPFKCLLIGLLSSCWFVSASIINSGIIWGVKLFNLNLETDDACAELRPKSELE